jgi:hypothetical protein
VASTAHEFDALGLITWDLGAWYAEDPDWTDPGDGGLIDQWDDGGSGTARHMLATTTARPTYSAAVAAFNGQPAVTVDGGDKMSISGTITAPTRPYSIVVIGKFGSIASSSGLIGRGTGGANTCHLYANQPTGEFRLYAGGTALQYVAAAADTDVHLFRCLVTSTASAAVLEVDGTAATGSLGAQPDITSIGLFAVSGGSSPATSGSGIAFAGLFSGDVADDAGWADFKAEAATHYGLTIT